MDVQTTILPNASEGELTKASKSISLLWKIALPVVGFIGLVYSGSKAWIAIEQNTNSLKELKEQVTRQYSTHKNEVDALRKDSDEELDVLEEELDKIKDEFHYHQAYDQAMKDLKK